MIDNRKVLGIIPARGGSKRLHRKNTRLFCKSPLLCWTILEARKSSYIDQLIVSTDDEEISIISRQYDCLVLNRPMNLATDEATSADVVIHALDNFPKFDLFVLLQPTSPLRLAEDIDYGIEMGTGMSTFPNGVTNGAVYAANVKWFREYRHFELTGFVMPEDRSIDINTEEDFKKAEELMRKRANLGLNWDG